MSYGDYPSTSLRAGSEQLTYLLFLKMADERSKPPYNQKSPVPDWPSMIHGQQQ
jgi:type I restriction enzyme M protein